MDLELKTCKGFSVGLDGFHTLRKGRGFFLINKEGAYGSMRTYIGTLVTLDAVFHDPLRHVDRNAAFLILGGANRKYAVRLKSADRKFIALLR